MYFQHDAALWRDFPDLVPGALYATGITAAPNPNGTEIDLGLSADSTATSIQLARDGATIYSGTVISGFAL